MRLNVFLIILLVIVLIISIVILFFTIFRPLSIWNTYLDRAYMKELYPRIGSYLQSYQSPKVLDIGVEDYNRINKSLFNHDNIEYWQIDMKPFDHPDIRNSVNNGYMQSSVMEVTKNHPEKIEYFDVIISYGVLSYFDWNDEQILLYLKNIKDMLKSGGLLFLKVDSLHQQSFSPEHQVNINRHVRPYFKPFQSLEFPYYHKIINKKKEIEWECFCFQKP